MLRNSGQGQKIVNRMGTAARSWANKKPNESMKLIVTTFVGIVFSFLIGVSFPTLSLTKLNLPFSLLPNIDLSYIEDKGSSISTLTALNVLSSLKGNNISSNQAGNSSDTSKIWVPTNPRGAERLQPNVVAS